MLLKNKYSLAIISGLLLSLAWPFTGSISPLIFVAWVPVLYLFEQNFEAQKGNRAIFLPLFLGLWIWNLGTTHWLFFVEESMGTKIFSLLSPSIANALIMTLPWLAYGFMRKYLGLAKALIGVVFLWLGYEYFHQNWELTWPWLLLGNVFALRPNWIQWYEYTGVQGGTLWVLLVNITLFRVLLKARTDDWKNALKSKRTIYFALALIAPIIWSYIVIPEEKEQGDLGVLVIQPNLNPYEEKFSSSAYPLQLAKFIDQINAHPSAELALLPETALQERTQYTLHNGEYIKYGLWEEQIEKSESVRAFKNKVLGYSDISILSGMSSQRMVPLPYEKPQEIRPVYETEKLGRIAYNSALFINNKEIGIYHKSKLVPGVEITPYAWIFSMFKEVALDLGGITGTLGTQSEREVFTSKEGIVAAPVICYESVFGEYMGGYINKGANLITVLTNDGWWQRSAGHKQHFVYSVLRAIEFRRDVIRSANTGISCHINQRGEVLQRMDYETEGSFVCYPNLNDELTVFAKMGDYLGKNALFLGILMIVMTLVKKVKANSVL